MGMRRTAATHAVGRAGPRGGPLQLWRHDRARRGLQAGVDAGDATGAGSEQRGAGEDEEGRGETAHGSGGHAGKQSRRARARDERSLGIS